MEYGEALKLFCKFIKKNGLVTKYGSITNIENLGQQSGQQSGQQTTIENYKQKLLEYCIQAKTAKEIKEYLNIRSRQYISTYLIKPLIKEGKLDYTNKNSINARNQKYISLDISKK